MLKLYDYLPSQNAYKIRLLLNHLAQPYDSIMVSIFEAEGENEAYYKISPLGGVPAIELEDGRTLAESNAILVYLAEGSPYLPKNTFERAKVMQWLCFEGETVQSGVATLRHWVQTGKDKNRSANDLESKRQLSLKALTILERELGDSDYLGSKHYTIADMSVFAYVHLAEEANIPLVNHSNILHWIDRVRSQVGFLDKTYPYSIDPNSVNEL